jgi:hypothetical protein
LSADSRLSAERSAAMSKGYTPALTSRICCCDGVALLHDRDHLVVLRAQRPAVTGRVVQRGGQHGDCGAPGVVRGDQVGQRVGVE